MKSISYTQWMLVFSFMALFAIPSFASEIDMIPIVVTDSITNIASATADTGTTTSKANGWLDTIVIDLTGHASPNVDIDITASSQLGTQTLFSIDDITADGIYPVRDLATTAAGADIAATPARFPLLGAIITVSMSDSDSATNVNVNAYFVMSPTP